LATIVAGFIGSVNGAAQPFERFGKVTRSVHPLCGLERELHVIGVAGLCGRNGVLFVSHGFS
jgi:hypothetical protein